MGLSPRGRSRHGKSCTNPQYRCQSGSAHRHSDEQRQIGAGQVLIRLTYSTKRLTSQPLNTWKRPTASRNSFRRPLQGLTDLNGSIRQRRGRRKDSRLDSVSSGTRGKISQPERRRLENARAIVFAFPRFALGRYVRRKQGKTVCNGLSHLVFVLDPLRDRPLNRFL